jgi:large subunit ribosomal protein L10
MENPRPEKVAVVEEVREKLDSADAVVFTEYRGLSVSDLYELRGAIRAAGGEYRIYKNTLVRRATRELNLDLDEILTGPTALTFVTEKPDGTPGDAVLVAKAIKNFAKSNPLLVLKGGRLGDQLLDVAGINSLADVAPREELLARFAGGLAAPMTNFARLLQALPQNFAYALQALIEAGGASGDEGGSTEETPGASDGAASADVDDSADAADSADTEADTADDASADEPAGDDSTPDTEEPETEPADTADDSTDTDVAADAADTAEADAPADEEK